MEAYYVGSQSRTYLRYVCISPRFLLGHEGLPHGLLFSAVSRFEPMDTVRLVGRSEGASRRPGRPQLSAVSQRRPADSFSLAWWGGRTAIAVRRGSGSIILLWPRERLPDGDLHLCDRVHSHSGALAHPSPPAGWTTRDLPGAIAGEFGPTDLPPSIRDISQGLSPQPFSMKP